MSATMRGACYALVWSALALSPGSLWAQEEAPAAQAERVQPALSRTLARAVAQAAPWMVLIRPGGPGGEGRAARRLGRSGVVLAPGVLVTSAANLEVFGLDDLVAEDASGEAWPARVRGRDLRLGIVVLQCPQLEVQPAPRAQVPARPGSLVLALGTPLRDLGLPSATFGLLSAMGRFQGRAHQLDAALDASNIGGALIDLEGRFLGVLVQVGARIGHRSGVGFAVPPERIDPVLPLLLAGEQLEVGTLGLLLPKVGSQGLGVEVRGVSPRGPAAVAGLQAGDRILSLEGRATATLRAFREAASLLYAGQEIELELLREKVSRRVSLQVFPR